MMLQRTPLHAWHVAHQARMTEFAGWSMPMFYRGVLEEHRAVRQRCGLFDVSHMGEISVEGRDAEDFLQTATCNDVRRLRDGEAQYSLLLNERGGVKDDVIVYRFSEHRYRLCVNAANSPKDLRHLQAVLCDRPGKKMEMQLRDESAQLALLALQGPKAAEVLLGFGFELSRLRPFQFIETELAGLRVALSRTGYTGEPGCEIFLASAQAEQLWNSLLDQGKSSGLQAAGLGARDTLRMEMGYALYGHELSEETHPLEAGLGWVVAWGKGDFIGKTALEDILRRNDFPRQTGLVMVDPGIPRAGQRVFGQQKPVGVVTSGTLSPSLQAGIALARISARALQSQQEFFVDIRGKMKKAKAAKLPFIIKK